jgi:hypothetical protein
VRERRRRGREGRQAPGEEAMPEQGEACFVPLSTSLGAAFTEGRMHGRRCCEVHVGCEYEQPIFAVSTKQHHHKTRATQARRIWKYAPPFSQKPK